MCNFSSPQLRVKVRVRVRVVHLLQPAAGEPGLELQRPCDSLPPALCSKIVEPSTLYQFK